MVLSTWYDRKQQKKNKIKRSKIKKNLKLFQNKDSFFKDIC